MSNVFYFLSGISSLYISTFYMSIAFLTVSAKQARVSPCLPYLSRFFLSSRCRTA